jgi:hypothetical protein
MFVTREKTAGILGRFADEKLDDILQQVQSPSQELPFANDRIASRVTD